MNRHRHIRGSMFLAAALAAALGAGVWAAAGAPLQNPPPAENPPTPEEVRRMTERILDNQRRNEASLAEFERREHRREWRTAEHQRLEVDKIFRVVPTGTGTIKLVLEEKGQPVKPAFYVEQLRVLEEALDTAANRPDDPRQRRAIEKWEKRRAERKELVDAVSEAFEVRWLGREMRDGRNLAKVRMMPRPGFKPQTRIQEIFRHVEVTVWVDDDAGQMVRAEADIINDISFGGGLFGKVSKGGRFVMEQSPAGNGLWLPSLYRFDYSGRKFIFPFSVHEEVRISDYRRIGPPAEALVAVRREIAEQARGLKSASD
ncbi:MAG TPA: hypothetical protein VGA40_02180 [Candidatus Acidoferrales bacterium]